LESKQIAQIQKALQLKNGAEKRRFCFSSDTPYSRAGLEADLERPKDALRNIHALFEPVLAGKAHGYCVEHSICAIKKPGNSPGFVL
jgi:hypothetical protein